MSTNIRVSPGVYRTASGQLTNSASGGSSAPRPRTAAPAGTPPAQSYMTPQLQQAQSNLSAQVAGGLISQGQMDAELNRLRMQTNPAGAGMSFSSPSDVINTTFGAAATGQQQGNLLTNPNQVNPFGSQTVTFGPDGQPTVTQGLSQGNQNVVGGIQGNAQAANSGLNPLIGYLSGMGGDSAYQDAYYNQLTKGFGDQKAREGEQLSQSLAQRGIPVGSAAYNDQMKQFNTRYDDMYSNARNQAITGSSQQALQSAGLLSGIGQAGFMNPSFQGFTPVGYQQPDIGGLFGTLTQQGIANAQIAAQNRNRGGGGGGGGSSRPAGPPRFNIVAPPGS